MRGLPPKSLLRWDKRIELLSLYAILFSFLSFILFIEGKASESAMISRYFKYVIDYKLSLIATMSAIMLAFYYQSFTKFRIEVRCRMLSGCTLKAIRARYFIESLFILSTCLLFFILINTALRLSLFNHIYLYIILLTYIMISTFLLRHQ